MKRIGILGGTTAESSVEYYRHITREYTRRFGDYGYPEIVLFSVTFQPFLEWMSAGDWRSLANAVCAGLKVLGDAGAEIGLLATNTFHRVFDEVAASAPMPLISLLDVVADRLEALGCRRAALLGTKMTMEGSFYQDRLADANVATLVPRPEERETIHRIILEELGRGIVRPESKRQLLGIVERLIAQGADAVILGCTELPLLLGLEDVPVAVLDTTRLHANAALEAAAALAAAIE